MLTVSVDFDGTITESTIAGDRGFNQIRYMCKEMMDELSKMGVRFILLTARKKYLKEAIDLCKKWELPIDVSTPNEKQDSDYYIDDKALGGMEIDWIKIGYMLSRVIHGRTQFIGGIQ